MSDHNLDSVQDAFIRHTGEQTARCPMQEPISAIKGTAGIVCANCGEMFQPTPGKKGQKFCSPYCRQRAWITARVAPHVISELRNRIKELERRISLLEKH